MPPLGLCDEIGRDPGYDGKAPVGRCGSYDPIGHLGALSEGEPISFTNAAPVNVLVIHGPNLNLLGTREPETYGHLTLVEVDAAIAREAEKLGMSVTCVQHNSEGAIVDELHAARGAFDAVVLNAGAYTHYGYAIRDAIAAIALPTVEVHLSNTLAREPFRATSVIGAVCRGSIAGFGVNSYRLALAALASLS